MNLSPDEIDLYKKDKAKWEGDKNQILQQLPELKREKQRLEELIAGLRKDLFKAEDEYKKNISENTRKANLIIEAANKRDAETVKQESCLREIGKSLQKRQEELFSEESSLRVRRDIIDKLIKDFSKVSAEREEDFRVRFGKSESENDEKLRNISLAISKNQKLIEDIKTEALSLNEKTESFLLLNDKLNSERSKLNETLALIEEKNKEALKAKEETDENLRKVDARYQEIMQKEGVVEAQKKDLSEKNWNLDLKRREVEALQRKVDSLIQLHKLEGELNVR